jgi:hypothetical protein
MESSHTSICEMDYCGINKIGSMFQKGSLGMCCWRSAMMGPLWTMVVQNTPTLFKKTYYWPNLKDDAEEYMKTCLTC